MSLKLIRICVIGLLVLGASSARPESAEEFFFLGNRLSDERKFDEAVSAYRESLRRSPDRAVVYYNMGLAYKGMKDYARAVEVLEKVVRLEPDNLDAHLTLGNVLNLQERWEDAIAHLIPVTEERPEDAEAHGNLGWALYHYRSGPPFKLLVLRHLERAVELFGKQGLAAAEEATRRVLEEARQKFGDHATGMI